jgi:hypothetical protein
MFGYLPPVHLAKMSPVDNVWLLTSSVYGCFYTKITLILNTAVSKKKKNIQQQITSLHSFYLLNFQCI